MKPWLTDGLFSLILVKPGLNLRLVRVCLVPRCVWSSRDSNRRPPAQHGPERLSWAPPLGLLPVETAGRSGLYSEKESLILCTDVSLVTMVK